MRARKRGGGQSGFSLLSVIVAIALLAFLFVALTRGVITVQDAHRFSHYTTVANTLAQAKLEQLTQERYQNIQSGADANPVNETGMPVAQGCFARFWTVQDDAPGPDMKTVEVRVEWNLPQWNPDASHQHVVRLSTVVSSEAKTWL